jgi:hypothetical protein
MKRLALTAAAAALLCAGCPSKSDDANKDAGSATTGARPADAGADAETEDEVRPVYDVTGSETADPQALRLCGALSEVQEKKRAACCNTSPGIVLTDECSRMLGAAIRGKAVSVSAEEITACIAALERRYDGCDWVGPFPPGPPAECTNLVRGLLGEGARCRSTLECAGNGHCAGLTPTRTGKCVLPSVDGAPCGGTVDPLVGFARQSATDKTHPECEHKCIQHKCGPPLPDGASCTISAECEAQSQCIGKKCVKAPPAKLGQSCPGGLCESPAECIQGVCAEKKAAGTSCAADFECKGGCRKGDGGSKGTCGPRCDVR